jgi:hypothetical protein
VDFRGHLRLPDDAGSGIPVVLRIDDIFVILISGAEELGAWRADDVGVERIFSNQFALDLDGEAMVFIASDALGFAYEGVAAIEDLQERLTKRRVFRRKKKVATSEPTEIALPDPEATPEPTAPRTVHTPSAERPEPEPFTDEPAPILSPKPIWTPPTSTPPAVEPVSSVPDFERVSRADADGPDEPPPADERVVYPRPAALSPPATMADEPMVTSAAVDTPPTAPLEPEYEIEEVEQAATGVGWAADVPAPVVEEAEVAYEIEDYVLPTGGAAETFTPVDRTAQPPEPVEAREVETGPGPTEDIEPEQPIPEQVPETPAEVEYEIESSTADNEVVVAAGVGAASTQSNGHRDFDELEVAESADDDSRPARKHSLFGRARDKKVPPHDHRYGIPKTIGGLTRSVCEVCGHVTFSGEDVYQDW